MKYFQYAALMLLLTAFALPPQKKVKVFLAGDSTIAIKEPRAYPETGWGMPFVYFFDSTVQIENRAKNGRSTRTFIEEGLWQKLIDDLSAGDYVFIQFGHNDESEEKKDRYTTPEQYKRNLKRFIAETKAKEATPLLFTPVSRRKFKDGQAVETHAVYSALVKEVAAETGVTLIDLDTKSRALYAQMGEETSKLFFLQLGKGEHPNYPDGKVDNTHFTELGARLVAQIVLAEIKAKGLPLADRIVKPVVKK